MSHHSAATAPRAADVARWVATLAAPDVVPVSGDHRDRIRQRHQRARAHASLVAWGFDDAGQPKPRPVTAAA